MTVQERILALRLIEKQEHDTDSMKRLGISIQIEYKSADYQNEKGNN